MDSRVTTITQVVGSGVAAAPAAVAGHVALAAVVAIAGLIVSKVACWVVLLIAQRRHHRHVEFLAALAAAHDLALVRAVLADPRPDRAQVLAALPESPSTYHEDP